MKSLIAPMLVTASLVIILFCGFAVAASIDAPYRPHHFKHLDASIWSDTPQRVDQKGETYERLAAVTPAERRSQTIAIRDPVDRQTADEAPSLPMVTDPIREGEAACEQRYRSYRPQDNSYQPFAGGPRRQCEIGVETTPLANILSPTSANTITDNPSSEHGT